jgi:HK97 family phage portal protein
MFNKIRSIFKEKSIGILPFLGRKTEASRIQLPETFYERSVYFNKALEKRATVVASVDMIPYKQNGDIDNEIHELLKKPNKFLSGSDFWALVQTYYDLYGKYFIWKEPKGQIFRANQIPEALHLLHPTDIEIYFDEGDVSYFQNKNTRQRYEVEEIIWEHRPDPKDPKEAVGILNEGGKDTLRTEIELREYQKNIARNGGRTSGVFSFDTESGLSEKQIRELKEGYRQHITEAKDDGQLPFFLGGKAQYMDLTRSPKEVEYLQSKQMILEEVSTITGVPKTILSAFDDIKFSNAKEARVTFLSETINPIIKKRVETLNNYLAPQGITIEPEEIVPEDVEEILKIVEISHKTRTLSPNERRELLGYEEIPGGDELEPQNATPPTGLQQ